VKVSMLRTRENTQMRNTDFDALVSSDYQHYVDSPDVCERIVDPQWDPPTLAVARWV
jgi:hypothetical protein